MVMIVVERVSHHKSSHHSWSIHRPSHHNPTAHRVRLEHFGCLPDAERASLLDHFGYASEWVRLDVFRGRARVATSHHRRFRSTHHHWQRPVRCPIRPIIIPLQRNILSYYRLYYKIFIYKIFIIF